MARGRNRNAETVEDATVETVTDNTENSETAKTERKPVDVGQVTISEASVDTLPERESKLDTNPVAQAVKTATPGKVYDILADADKADAIVSVLVRAGARYGVGVRKHVDRSEREDGKVKVQFSTGERRTRKAKNTDAEAEQPTTPLHAEIQDAFGDTEATPDVPSTDDTPSGW